MPSFQEQVPELFHAACCRELAGSMPSAQDRFRAAVCWRFVLPLRRTWSLVTLVPTHESGGWGDLFKPCCGAFPEPSAEPSARYGSMTPVGLLQHGFSRNSLIITDNCPV